MDKQTLSPATQIVALGRELPAPGGQLGAPLVLTSTYHADGAASYARMGNPTWSALEETLGALEGGHALIYASGMAAITAALSLVPHGGLVIAPRAAYNTTVASLEDRHSAGEIILRLVDITDTAAVLAGLDGAALLWLESPTNPLLEVPELSLLVGAAKAAGALVVVDNTLATPLLQQPLTVGADIVVHSVTKYLSGHSDLVMGAVVTSASSSGRELHDRLARHRQVHGSIAGPFEAWLALRGLRTLEVRFSRACANAATLTTRLRQHRSVERVRYPEFGAMISIEVIGGAAGAEAVSASTSVWVHSTSLGGVESQIERRRRHALEPAVVPDNLLRLSVGIEDVEDLWADLDAALQQADASRSS